jgi:hypothetical protein
MLPAAVPDEVRYLRLLPDKSEPECTFTTQRDERGWTITSVTGRGAKTLTVTTRYDARNILLDATAVAGDGERKQTVRVGVKDGKAAATREAGAAQEFDVPPGVIVTSAPDWTDTFLLCRRYDRKKDGKQEFPGLWIHPVQPAQRLTFSIERVGTDVIEHGGKEVKLERHRIHIRNNSAYVAWTDGDGGMIKLMSVPVREKGGTTLVRAGYERSASMLRPPE